MYTVYLFYFYFTRLKTNLVSRERQVVSSSTDCNFSYVEPLHFVGKFTKVW